MSIIVLAHHRVLMHKGGEDKGAAYFAYFRCQKYQSSTNIN
jgi:hypothetical protein